MLPSYSRQFGQTPQKQTLRSSYNLWVHDDRFSKQDLVINPDCFPGCRVGDLLEIFHPTTPNGTSNTNSGVGKPSQSHSTPGPSAQPHQSVSPPTKPRTPHAPHRKAKTLVLQVTSIDREISGKQPQLQISIAQHVAALFELQARTDVIVRKIDKDTVAADYVELNFRDQYVGRSDMWRLKTMLTNSCVYHGKKLFSLGIRAQIKDIVSAGKRFACGYITENTKTIFRSETAKYFIFIQMSKEMWEFDEDGELYFEKCVHGFLPQLLSKWKEGGTNHVVSIVLFARIHYHNQEELAPDKRSSLFEDKAENGDNYAVPILVDTSGRAYRDFYRVVVDWEIRSEWSQVLIPLKKEFISFQRDVLQQPTGDGSTVLSGSNSPACEGNILEAINLALNPFDRHYIDRDLSRTGLSIVIITPGSGTFEVDKKLLRLTAQRMVDNGIGLDLVCLSKPPLYTVPLFQFLSKDWAGISGWAMSNSGTSADTESAISGEKRWATPGTGATNGRLADRSFEKAGLGVGGAGVNFAGGGMAGGGTAPGAERRLEAWDPLYYDDPSPSNPERPFFMMPNWVMCSFWTRDDENSRSGFTLRCKMYEVQMMGVMEQIGSAIIAPYFDKNASGDEISEGKTLAIDAIVSRSERSAGHPERAAQGGVRFEIGGEDDDDSPAMSVHSDSPFDCDRYDELVFAPSSRHRPLLKHRSNSAVNTTALENDATASVKAGRTGQRADAHQQSIGPNRNAITGNAISVSPEGLASATLAAVARSGYHRPAPGDTVRSVDSDGAGIRALHPGSTYYYPWEDVDTLNVDERTALLRAKARIEQARQVTASGSGTVSQLRPIPSHGSFAHAFPGAKSATGSVDGQPADKKGQRPQWFANQQSMISGSGMGSRKGSRNISDGSTGALELRGNQDLPITGSASFDGPEIPAEHSISIQGADVEDNVAAPASTSLAPIRIHSGGHMSVRATRDGFSGSGSYKGGHSPLTNYEYLRQYPKLSPGKTQATGLAARNFLLQSSLRPNLINPCNPSRNVVRATSQLFRWQHVFPQILVPTRNDIVMHWKSLSTPACLPLTTDFFPTAEELSEFYEEYTYTVSPADDATPYQSRGEDGAGANSGRLKVEALLMELVGQRLAQGFQLIASGLGASTSTTERPDGNVSGGTLSPVTGRQSQDKQANKRLIGSFADVAPRHQRPLAQGQRHSAHQQQHPLQPPDAPSNDAASTMPVSIPYYLSLGDHVHRLFYDASGQNVEVKRYVRKVTYSTFPIHYACGIWPKHDTFYRPKRMTFTYPPVTMYNWNYLDHLISGYQEEMTENLRFWRTRFLLIPLETVAVMSPFLNPQGENLDEEEVRLVGFAKFIEVFERARWVSLWEEEEAKTSGFNGVGLKTPVTSKKMKNVKGGLRLEIQLTTFNTARFVRDEVLGGTEAVSPTTSGHPQSQHQHLLQVPLMRRGSISSMANGTPATPATSTNIPAHSSVSSSPTSALTRSAPFQMIAQAMVAPPPIGVAFCDRRWHFRLYERVFIGSECVDWIIRNFTDIDTREEAVEFGNSLLKEGLFEHANMKHRFLDGHYFYRIRTQHLKSSSGTSREKDKGQSWFATRGKPGTPGDSDVSEGSSAPSGTSSGTATPIHTSQAQLHVSKNQEQYRLSRRMVIDLDPQRRSPRRETAVLHYDTVHNPRNCFHFQLHWLVCSPRWIEDLVGGWARVAEKCGFKMVEAGIEQAEPLSDDNPFQSVTRIIPAAEQPPLPHSSLPSTFYLTELVRKFNFVLDVEADSAFPPGSVTWSYDRGRGYQRTQWVHRSGVAFVQIGTAEEGGGFWWVANRMHLTGSGSAPGLERSGGSAKDLKGAIEKNPDPETLRKALMEFCESADQVKEFWEEVRRKFREMFGSPKGDEERDTLSTKVETDDRVAEENVISEQGSAVEDAFEDVGDDAGATVVRVAAGDPSIHVEVQNAPESRPCEGGDAEIMSLPIRSPSILDPQFFSPPFGPASTPETENHPTAEQI
ncbi:hypothetical protein SpCBS45565_g07662 [Spizellomyces sp. 'palustris']|nr:hypothetical protein SpCBS45565_g07662 [Spizellomyces sp. 'palustris']